MELGNWLFGHSRGRYAMERGKGFEEELTRLFDAIDPSRDTSWREYGVSFENDVFSTMPYYWGDCTCGFDEEDMEWAELHHHASNCFREKRKRYDEELKTKGIKMYSDEYVALIDKWAKENGWPHGFEGSGGYCDCGYQKEYEDWRKEHNHSTDCPIVRPNFHYKPTDFSLDWYKYLLRDSYTNQEVTLDKFKEIIDACIQSLASSPSHT